MRSDTEILPQMKTYFFHVIPLLGVFGLFSRCLSAKLNVLTYFSLWPLNSCLHSLVGKAMAPWAPRPAAKTSMPRDNEGDRRLCSLLMSTQSLWFCIWNRDVKLVARQTVRKKLSWITQVWIYFVPASLLFLSTVALYCHYQGHKWVRNGNWK